jgi:hypothetical protein
MGIEISLQHFDTVDLMKDLELARHVLERPKVNVPSKIDGEIENDESGHIDVPLLEWLDEDSEAESFTIVQSRKKKKKQAQFLLENPVLTLPVRRSQRTAPSIYRSRGGQENLVPTKQRSRNKRGVS